MTKPAYGSSDFESKERSTADYTVRNEPWQQFVELVFSKTYNTDLLNTVWLVAFIILQNVNMKKTLTS